MSLFGDFGPMLAGADSAISSWSANFTNPDAETGDLTGWTQTVGIHMSVNATGPHGGTYKFVGSTDEAVSEAFNTALDLPGAALTAVDAGTARATLTYWIKNNADGDAGLARLEFYGSTGGTGTYLGARSDSFGGGGSWAERTNNWMVPAGTRSVVLYMVGRRSNLGGTELSFYWDDIGPLVLNDGYHSATIYTCRGADGSGWTVDTGSGQPVSVASGPWSWPGIACGSQASYSAHKDVAVSSLSAAAQAAIAAGSATLHLERWAWNTNASDASRIACDCRASGSVVATVQDAGATTAWGTGTSATIDHLADGTVSVPTSTDTFRVTISFTRHDGTVNDARMGFPHIWLTW